MSNKNSACGCGTSVSDCCGGSKEIFHSELNIVGGVETVAGVIPVVSPDYCIGETLGSWRIRWGLGRYSYSIEPGIYAVGEPDKNSPVFTTANYKMTFDKLKKELEGIDCFILVLDTKGINVWCAAGKGTFGTEELVKRIKAVGLPKIVSHKKVIVPQLGAPGVAAHVVAKKTGFKVVYGPVRASDIPAFLKKGMIADKKMRKVDFPFKDRIVLAPMELVGAWKILAGALIFIALLELLGSGKLTTAFFVNSLPYLGAVLAGAVLFPMLLPWLPGRAFAFKGWLVGLLYVSIISNLFYPGTADYLSWVFILPAISAFVAMNFTGCSTYTSLSGVMKEMKYAIPLIILSVVAGIISLIRL